MPMSGYRETMMYVPILYVRHGAADYDYIHDNKKCTGIGLLPDVR